MNNAKNIACELLYRSEDARFEESIRQYQGCPTVAVTHGGRIYLGWYSGGTREPHMENYNLLVYSDNGGKDWSKPLLIIPSSKELFIHALDIQLWVDPKGRLHVYWVQNNSEAAPEVLPVAKKGQPLVAVDGYMFGDFTHACWETVCENPDSDEPIFSPARYLDKGFLRCKPLVLKNDSWVNFNYDQADERYGYSISVDEGKSYGHRYGAKKLATCFDEAMAYQKKDGSIRMLARCSLGELAESYSYDNGMTWTEAKLSGIVCADTRFFVSYTPSGRLLLVTNDDGKTRKNLTLKLSEDEGASWKYACCIDTRDSISYPDVDFFEDKIYLTYDRERTGAKEILFTAFVENDIMNSTVPPATIVSKP